MAKRLNFTPTYWIVGKLKKRDRIGVIYWYDTATNRTYFTTLDKTIVEMLRLKYLVVPVKKGILEELAYESEKNNQVHAQDSGCGEPSRKSSEDSPDRLETGEWR